MDERHLVQKIVQDRRLDKLIPQGEEQPQIVQSERDFTPDQTARIRDLENQLDEVRQDRDSWRDQAQANQRLLEDKSGQGEQD